MRNILIILCFLFIGQPCLAWSEGGHHLIALMAFELLSPEERQQILVTLSHHPRYAEDFKPPVNITGQEETFAWLIGRAGCWPDIARTQPLFHRPNWHHQAGATLRFGAELNVPKAPGPLPKSATLDTQELYIAQAIELCRNIVRDKSKPDRERALALSWILHLVADAHQPCHAGSLYMVIVFPEGDRWATSIPTKQGGNLHLFWDELLGQNYDPAGVRRRTLQIREDRRLWTHANDVARGLSGLVPTTWLAESAEHGKDDVYSPEVMIAVDEAMNRSVRVTTIDLSPKYLKNAEEVANKRAAFAAHRLAAILREGLQE